MSKTTISIETAVYEGLKESIAQYTFGAIRRLSTIYGFDYDEAVGQLSLDKIDISKTDNSPPTKERTTKTPTNKEHTTKTPTSKKSKTKKPEIDLPFCGQKMEGFCNAIKKSGGLYNQCNKPTKKTYCTICQKQADKNSTNKPNLGDISDRIEQGDNWCDPTGKKPVKYAKVMAKQNITKETAIEVAARYGLTISESEFALDNVKKGRPKKSVSADDTDDEKEIKKRGRPVKVKDQEDSSPGDDLIASLIKEAKNEDVSVDTPLGEKNQMEHSADNDMGNDAFVVKLDSAGDFVWAKGLGGAGTSSELEEEEVIEVKKIEINQQSYLVDQNNVVYDEDQNVVGTLSSDNNIEPIS